MRIFGCAFLYLNLILLSLSCILIFSASESAPIFFFALPKKKTVAGGQKKKGALYGLDKGTIQPGFLQTAGAYRASLEGLCAFPDAQPLTLAVCATWQSHWRSTSRGRTMQRFRRAASANLGESKGAAHGPLSSFQMGVFRGKKSKSSP